jgi:Ca-activated chloride channel family protein
MPHGKPLLLAAFALTILCKAASATGILVPEDQKLPALAIKSHRVAVTIAGNVATTRVSEAFLNSTGRRLEATYIFPVPRDAALTDFAMFINGKRQSGEVVEAGRAREIYQDIVRRLRDPGLLEYMDSGLLRMKVFPVEPNSVTEVEVTYAHTLPFESGAYEYTFPLRTGHKASRVLEDFTISADITSPPGAGALTNVYSPTHEIGVTRKDDYHAVVGLEKSGVTLDTDFTLIYTVSRKDFGFGLLTHRREGQDGYFALMLSPRVDLPQDKVMAKDVCLALDTSGSMEEQNRIASARDAIEFCLKALNPGDRFALITFSTTVETFGAGLADATPEAVQKAVAYVDKLEPRGATDLCGAVLQALSMAPKGDRPYLIVLVTDGKPTVGVTDSDAILKKVGEANKANVRVFTFGIAEDLNVPLLDRIAEATKGYSDYVAPGRQIEDKISSFFRKVSYPVLADLQLSFGNIKVTDMYPAQLPDLFRGSQIVAFGRYSGSGDVAVALTGTLQGRKEKSAYDATFPKENAANGFLPQLWARRKVGYLLDQIRLHGETKELMDEVVRLSKEYGIATPYTSYLVLENEDAYRQHGIMRAEAVGKLQEVGAVRNAAMPVGASFGAALPQDRAEAETRLSEQRAILSGGPKGGRESVELSMSLRSLKDAGALPAGPAAEAPTVRRVDDKTFVLLRGTYVDTAFTEKMEILKVRWGSDAYFAALDAMPEIKRYLSLGESVVVVIGGKALAIADEGKDKMSAAEIKAFFGK